MAGAGDDLQLDLGMHLGAGAAVQVEDRAVVAADDQEGRRPHPRQDGPARSGRPPREMTARTASGRSAAAIRAAAAPVLAPKSAMAPGAAGCVPRPVDCRHDAAAQHRDTEAMLTRLVVDRGLGRTQEIEQERAEAGGLERAGDGAVAGAEAAAAAAVREHDQAGGRGRDAQVGLELDARVSQDANGAPDRGAATASRLGAKSWADVRTGLSVHDRRQNWPAGDRTFGQVPCSAPPRSRTRQRVAAAPALAS